MSGRVIPGGPPAPGAYKRAPAQVQVPLIGTTEQKLGQLAQAIARKADIALEPSYAAVLLMAPDGSLWRLTVNSSGTLQTAQVVR